MSLLHDAWLRADNCKPGVKLHTVDLSEDPRSDIEWAAKEFVRLGRKVTTAIINPVPLAKALSGYNADVILFNHPERGVGVDLQADPYCPKGHMVFWTVPA